MIFEPGNCSQTTKEKNRRSIKNISELEGVIKECFFSGIDTQFDEICIEPAGIQIMTHKKIYMISVRVENKNHKTVVGILIDD